MCGIVGYVGEQHPREILINGLKSESIIIHWLRKKRFREAVKLQTL